MYPEIKRFFTFKLSAKALRGLKFPRICPCCGNATDTIKKVRHFEVPYCSQCLEHERAEKLWCFFAFGAIYVLVEFVLAYYWLRYIGFNALNESSWTPPLLSLVAAFVFEPPLGKLIFRRLRGVGCCRAATPLILPSGLLPSTYVLVARSDYADALRAANPEVLWESVRTPGLGF
ncbi:MAG: hypothetical protein JSS72_03145 [Armatimonadetes bacterium]|nr:hypothetical protein [Armatimonadota bacterium]